MIIEIVSLKSSKDLSRFAIIYLNVTYQIDQAKENKCYCLSKCKKEYDKF